MAPAEVSPGQERHRLGTGAAPARRHQNLRKRRFEGDGADGGGAAEISDIIRQQPGRPVGRKSLEVETGTVLSTGDGIARIYGPSAPLSASCSSFRTTSTAWC